METTDIKERFIELRAKGYSFDKIAKKLSKSKQVLIDWSRELEEEVANAKALELEALYEKFRLLKEDRIKDFAELLKSVKEELKGRELSDIHTGKLIELYMSLSDKLEKEMLQPKFRTSQEIEEEKEEKELLDKLTAPVADTGKTLKVV